MKAPTIFKLLFTILIASNLSSQSKSPLSKLMWKQVKTCYSNLEDMDEDGEIDFDELIDDSKNGYLKISGGWPTCGCTCENTVGAFKNNKGQYTLIKKDSWGCSWINRITSNRNLRTVFPTSIEHNGFFEKEIDNDTNKASFYIDIEIPRKGTDTKVSIHTIPFGLSIKSKSIVSFGYYQDSDNGNYKSIYYLRDIVKKTNDTSVLNHILNNDFEKISEVNNNIISKYIGNDDSRFNSMEDLSITLNHIKKVYEEYNQIQHKWLILGWDREKGNFYIKEKGPKPQKISFIEFLIEKRYWSAMC